MTPTQYLAALNKEYLSIHQKKEEFFWQTYMGISDDHEGSANAQTVWTQYLSDPDKIRAIKCQLDVANEIVDLKERKDIVVGLTGWLTMFQAHAIESEQAQCLKAQLIQFEAELFEKKQNHLMYYIDENGRRVEGSLPTLGAVIRTNDNEAVRLSAHNALVELEQWLLSNGLLELVKLRNQFARSLGYETFFDYSIVKTENMTTSELFTILDDFEQQTRQCHLTSLKQLAADKGEASLLAHNFVFSFAGDAMRELDQYVPFSKSLRRWVESFGRLNINYSGAKLTLDLLDRKGKYPNGFCHGPIPSFYDKNDWVAAKVNFTSNAKPDQIGSGYDGINTLFHEGGHAAHFANVKMNAPCFSQEFAPTSMAYAETQSMFCDSLLNDADWLKQYALNSAGEPVTDAIIKGIIESKQPFKAYEERSILVVPYFEYAMYQLKDDELQPERVTLLARECEKKILGLTCSPRPLMAIPHLLSDESACAYQGYLLAHMAVYQTRAYFNKRDGYLTDNPKIGPSLAEYYWAAGNSVSHSKSIEELTGEEFNAKYLADECNLTVGEAWRIEQGKMSALDGRNRSILNPLNATIKVVDGSHLLASNESSDEEMCLKFERYVEQLG